MKKTDILEIANQYQVFVLDLYGVIWKGTDFFPAAISHLIELKKKGKTVILLSNYPCLAQTVEKMWTQRGMLKGVHYDLMVTSGEVANFKLKSQKQGGKFYLVGFHPLDIFAGTKFEQTFSFEEADFVLCGEPMRQIDGSWREQSSIDFYKPELEALAVLNKPMLCPNPDKISHSNDSNEIAVRAGALAAYYETCGGKTEYIGKPYSEVFRFALQGFDKKTAVMVGDTLETDILGAKLSGIDSALTLCGMSMEDMNTEGYSNIEFYAESRKIVPNHYLIEF